MRLKRPECGSRSINKGFLFWPKTINYETRWLEYAYWEQKVYYYQGGWDYEGTQWLSKDEYLRRILGE